MFKKLLIKLRCDKGKHKWSYSRGICYVAKIDTLSIVSMRECGCCKRAEWKPFEHWEEHK